MLARNRRAAKAFHRLDGPNHSNLPEEVDMGKRNSTTKHTTGDPIFNAITEHRIAEVRYDAFTTLNDDMGTNDDRQAFEAASKASEAALDRMMSTPLTTAAGARKLLRYVGELDLDYWRDDVPRLLDNLLNSPMLNPHHAKAAA